MKPSRINTLTIGLLASVVYCFLAMLFINNLYQYVSISYIFVLPLVLGTIPVLFSKKEQLKSYKNIILLPWISVLTFFLICYVCRFEGMICLVVILAPFLLLGSLGAFIYRLIRLRNRGGGTKLYVSLLLPFLVLSVESNIQPENRFYTVSTSINIDADKTNVWENIKNVKDIQPAEITPHFMHMIGVPKPLDGRLDKEDIGGIRSITWEKGIRFAEQIKTWDEGNGFTYDIHVDPKSIPPTTLDEHVMIGGKYFDVVAGSYHINTLPNRQQLVTLTCTYRITTNLQAYSKLWADFLLNDFNEMILEVIKKRSEK